MLLNRCLRQATALEFNICYAETISEMQQAIRFYETNGFRRLSSPLGSSGHSHNDCWLSKELEVQSARL
jgi:putative acetyltransferase